jgi:23S rRNA A1618 N6-methylase RlmF
VQLHLSIIGNSAYGWSFVGTDIDLQAIKTAAPSLKKIQN